MSIVIVGLGNEIRGDDAVGLIVAREVHRRFDARDVDLLELATGGLELIERISGYSQVVVVDAAYRTLGKIGECRRLDWERHAPSQRAGGLHEVGLLEGLDLARRADLPVPQKLSVYVVEVADPFTFGLQLHPTVQAAVPHAVELILAAEFTVL